MDQAQPKESSQKGADKRRCKRLPRMLLTEEESNAILTDLQEVWAAHYADSSFVLETNDPVQWQRIEPLLRDADELDFQKLGVNVVFIAPHRDTRRQMCFTCPGHDGATCRLSVAANCLLEFPSLLSRLLPVNVNVLRNDIMRFRLWSFGRWEDVYIDSTLPMVSLGGNSIVYLEVQRNDQLHWLMGPQPRYMSLAGPQKHELELWPYYLEKAVAKLLGSYCVLRSLTFESALSLLMGCEVISRRITNELGQQATTLLRILTVMQRDSIVFLRQESESTLHGCPATCMLHRTEDVYIVLAFKQTTDLLDVVPPTKSRTTTPQIDNDIDSAQSQLLLQSTQLLVRRVCCTPMTQCNRCQSTPLEEAADAAEPNAGGGGGGIPLRLSERDDRPLLDMSQDSVFKDRGVFWESAAYLLGHFSYIDMCFFGQDVPPTAEEDLISLNLMPWMASRICSSWVRGKNSLASGSRRQQSCYSPHFVLELWAPSQDQPILVALTLRQAAVQWRRANKIPSRMQVYVISDTDLSRVTRRDLLELKSRDQLERRLCMAHQLTHRSVFTTGSIAELLVLRSGSFLIILEVGIPGDEGDFCLSVFTSSSSRLMPFQNIVDTSFEYGGSHPNATIRCREFLPTLND